MKICVFCSANEKIDPDFFQLTEVLGEWAAKNGHSIVYGGVNCGLMECVAKAAHEALRHMSPYMFCLPQPYKEANPVL